MHIIDCGIGKKSVCCLSCASSAAAAAVVVDNCQPVTWNRKSFRSFALMRHRTKSSRVESCTTMGPHNEPTASRRQKRLQKFFN